MNKGFTLIELVVVFTIISILSTIGIASFVNYSRTQSLESGVNNIVTTLNLAKSRSLSQVKPRECNIQTLKGYELTVTYPNSYKLKVVCSDPQGIVVTSYTLPKNITFDDRRTTSISFFFPVLTGGVVGSGTIAVTGYDKTRCIGIDGVGLVSLQPCQ